MTNRFGFIVTCVAAVSLCSGCRAIMGWFTPEARDPQVPRKMSGTWCSLGTTITWYNDNLDKSNGKLTTGYQNHVMKTLTFKDFVNRGIKDGCIADQLGKISKADYYTVEHGICDWARATPVGTFDDYVNNTRNGSFFATYRRLIDEIRALNPDATIILCTPRRAFGDGKTLPIHWYLPNHGIKLEEYAKAVRAIAAEEGFVVADFFKNSCHNENQLKATSIDVASQPNDIGYWIMGNEVLRAFAQVD